MSSSPPDAQPPELKSSGMDRFLTIASVAMTSWMGRVTAYLIAVSAVFAAYAKVVDQLKAHLPRGVPEWSIPACLATVFLLVGCVEGIPAILAHNRRRRQAQVSIEALKAGYFQLGPRQAGSEFTRSDNKHFEILAWLQQTNEPVLYVTGESGCGKSSLMEAWVIPQMERGVSAPLVLKLRGYQDPAQILDRELRRPGFVWKEPPNATYLHDLIRLACRRLGSRRLLVVFDQFEEFVILRTEDQRAGLATLLENLLAQPVPGLSLLFILRSDYLGLLENLALPKLLQDTNWKHVPPFTQAAARTFLRNSGMRIEEDLLQAVLREAADIEQTQGLVRPITVNLCGLVLGRFGGGLPRGFRPGSMIRGFLQGAVSAKEIRETSPKIVPRMISPQLTKHPCSVSALATKTGLAETDVRICLWALGQPEHGIVRPLDAQQDSWEISHDFLVPLLDSIFARWTISLWRRAKPWLPWALAGCVALIAFALPLLQEQLGPLGIRITSGRSTTSESERLGTSIRNAKNIKLLVPNFNNFAQVFRSDLGEFFAKPDSSMKVLLSSPGSEFSKEMIEMNFGDIGVDEERLKHDSAVQDFNSVRLISMAKDSSQIQFRYFNTQFRVPLILVDDKRCFLTIKLGQDDTTSSLRLELDPKYASDCVRHFNAVWLYSKVER